MFGYDLKQASTYFLEDENKVPKLIVLYIMEALFIFLGNSKSFLLNTILLILALYGCGYLAKNNNLRIIKPENKLPELNDWKDYFIIGTKYAIGITIWTVMILAICGFIGFLPAFLLGAINFKVFSMLFMVISVILTIGATLFAMVPAQIAFSINLKYKSFFDIKLYEKIIFKNRKLLLELISVLLVLWISCMVISAVFRITIILKILIPIVNLYVLFATSDLFGQFVRKAIKQ